jgi:DNA polymerase theta
MNQSTSFLLFQSIFQDANIRVDGFMGNQSPAGGLAAVDVAVCTIEKANGLINRLMEADNLDVLGKFCAGTSMSCPVQKIIGC